MTQSPQEASEATRSTRRRRLGPLVLVAALLLGGMLAAGVAYQWWIVGAELYSATSPDGRWRCVVSDLDPNPDQCTIAVCIQNRSGVPVAGERYTEYCDSITPGEPAFRWSADAVEVKFPDGRLLIGRFGDFGQDWFGQREN